MTVTIITGDALAELRKRPSESVHCSVTSPPYWGLRDYGIEPRVWGGDEACAHEWGDAQRTAWANSVPGPSSKTGGSNPGKNGSERRNELKWTGPFCQKCGAWRGAFGLEPTPELYIDHLVVIFEEVRRVLRPDGTLWLNLGDSYAIGAGKVGEHPGGGDRGANWAGRPGPGITSAAGYRGKKIRADRDGSHAGKHVAMAALGPMTQPNRMPIPGLKPKDLVGIPWMAAFALRRAGWWLRQDVIWAKPNPMPESATDRCTKAHEYLFLLTKSARYYYDAAAIAEPASYAPGCGWEEEAKGTRGGKRGAAQERPIDPEQSFRAIRATRNKRSVWTIPTKPYAEAHFATFPPELVEPCVRAGTSERGCCPRCLAPWERVTGVVDTGKTQKMPDGMATHAGGHDAIHRDGREKGAAGNPVLEDVTLGWWPGCRCDGFDAALPAYPRKPSRAKLDDEAAYQRAVRLWVAACERVNERIAATCQAVAGRATRPAVVLDPFGGAGTTGLVADRLQRDAVLVELNPGYAEMARRRIADDAGLFARAAE